MATDAKVKLLEQNINKFTSETATQPDTNLFIETCNLINSRGDLPKHGVAFLRKRFMSRNPKVLYLCLEFLEVATNACELNFFQLIAAKDFMSVLNAITSREVDKTVLDKMTHLIRYWTQVFGGYKDILPGIFAFYESLEKKGVSFPSRVDSKYAYLMNEKKKAEASRPSYDVTESHSSSQEGKWQKVTTGGSTTGSKTSPPKGHKDVPKKLKEDLDLVRQNILLTNEMIDAQDPSEDPKNNDVLTDLMQTLKSMENKLGEFITKTQDEAALNYLLEINDDLHKTFDRYKSIRRGVKPSPFVPSDIVYSIEREDESKKPKSQAQPQAQKPKAADTDLIDLLGDTSLNQNQAASGNAGQSSQAAAVQNLFDFDSPAATTTTTTTTTNTAAQGFGDFSQPATNTQPTTTETKAPVSLSDQLSSLYKTSGPTTGGQQQQQGGMGGFGGQQVNTSGFPINQGNNFQTSPGLGGGMSQNLGFGGMGGFGNQQQGGMGGFGGMGGQQQQQQGGMGGFGGMGGNTGFGGNQGMGGMGGFNTQQPTGMGGFGGMGGQQQQQQVGMGGFGGMGGMGGFSTAAPGGFGGMGGNTGFGGQQQTQQNVGGFGGMGGNTGFGGQQGGMGGMGGFSTAPSQGNAFNMGGMANALPTQQQQKPATTQKSPFDDLL